MRTNIEIDDALMAEVLSVTGARTKREAVEQGLRTLLRLEAEKRLLSLEGVGWNGDLDAMRSD